MPRTIALSMDGDKRAQLENSKVLTNAFGDVLRFLPRRTYENYLIDSAAIGAVLNALPFFKERPIAESAVKAWIKEHGADAKFGAADQTVLSSEWLIMVDAPRLLEELFQDLSEATEIYRKTLHSAELTHWLINNKRGSIEGLISYVAELVPPAHRVP